MHDFGDPRAHARTVAGGEYDRSQGGAQIKPIMPDRCRGSGRTPDLRA